MRDAAGAPAPFVTVTFAPTGSGVSDGSGLLDVTVNANDLSIPANHSLTAVGAVRWGQSYALAAPAGFVVQAAERPFEHDWYGGTVAKAKGGLSAGLVAFLAEQQRGGLDGSLEKTDPQQDADDVLRLVEQFRGEVGGGPGIGVQLDVQGAISSIESGAEATTERKGLSLDEWRFTAGLSLHRP